MNILTHSLLSQARLSNSCLQGYHNFSMLYLSFCFSPTLRASCISICDGYGMSDELSGKCWWVVMMLYGLRAPRRDKARGKQIIMLAASSPPLRTKSSVPKVKVHRTFLHTYASDLYSSSSTWSCNSCVMYSVRQEEISYIPTRGGGNSTCIASRILYSNGFQ